MATTFFSFTASDAHGRPRSYYCTLPPHLTASYIPPTPYTMSFVQDLLKPGGGIALIPFIRATIVVLLLMVM